MLCRITDEIVENPWDGVAEDEAKTLEDITLYELMGEEHSVWLGRNDKDGFDIVIENESGQQIIEKQLHECAAESMAAFCRQYLAHYERLIN
jgi:hypothetical protein